MSRTPLRQRLVANSQELTWRPVTFFLPSDELRLDQFLQSTSPIIYDELEHQKSDLAKIRRLPNVVEIADGKQHSDPECWVYYPWRNALVRLLPPSDFAELRTNRNQHKITRVEQLILAKKKIGVVGLSVGKASVITMAMEGIGTKFRLADFDELDLSNLNRLSACPADLGMNKAKIAARQIFEIDPFLSVEVFDAGITEGNIDAFFGEDESQLDLIVEEADDLTAKFLLREKARERGIPVVMETSDRGMLDIERFDLEPTRQLLHGLFDVESHVDLKELSHEQRLSIILRIVDASRGSANAIASLIEIEQSICTWPQLASDVALGSSLVANAARRILLGESLPSGRYFVDPNGLIRAESATTPRFTRETSQRSDEAEFPRAAPKNGMQRGSHTMSSDNIRFLVQNAILAPSGGNAQPWLFSWHGDHLMVGVDETRRSMLDVNGFGSQLAIGAASLNLEIAAATLGWKLRMRPIEHSPFTIEIRFLRSQVTTPTLMKAIHLRCTNRLSGNGERLTEFEKEKLRQAATPASLPIFEGGSKIQLAHSLGELDRFRFLHRQLHHELYSELRWSRKEVDATRDGIDILSLELAEVERQLLYALKSPAARSRLREIDGARRMTKSTEEVANKSAALCILSLADQDGQQDYFKLGRKLQEVWLTSTTLGLSLQPMTAGAFLLARLRLGGAGLSDAERKQLSALRERHRSATGNKGVEEGFHFRLSKTGPPSAISLRRPVEEVLTFHDGGVN